MAPHPSLLLGKCMFLSNIQLLPETNSAAARKARKAEKVNKVSQKPHQVKKQRLIQSLSGQKLSSKTCS